MNNHIQEELLPIERLKSFVEIIGLSFAGFGILAYVSGIIVLNFHLLRYGIYSFELFQNIYIIAGIHALAPIVLSFAILLSIVLFRPYFTNNKDFLAMKKKKVIIGKTILFILFLGIVVAAVILISWVYIRIFYISPPSHITYFIVCLVCLNLGIAYVTMNISGKIKEDSTGINKWGLPSGILFLFAFLILYLACYGLTVYDKIPSNFGGGDSSNIKIVIEKESISSFEEMGLSFPPNSCKSEELELVASTEKEFVFFKKSSGITIRIPREQIKAMLYSTSKNP